MTTIRILTTESDEASIFEVEPGVVPTLVAQLRDPDSVIQLTPRNGGTAYIPVRHVTYLHVAPEPLPIDDGPEIRDPSKTY